MLSTVVYPPKYIQASDVKIDVLARVVNLTADSVDGLHLFDGLNEAIVQS
jgi:hypothetical protein